jgi:hypothetical protein
MRKVIWVLFFLSPSISKAQVKLLIEKYDTVYAKQFTAKKVVVYKYGTLNIYLDYYKILQHINMLAQDGRYNFRTARDIQSRLASETSIGDTAYLEQAYFLRLNWIPFDDFLCSEIASGNCIIIDANGAIHKQFVLVTATRRNERYFVWGGILYFLPGQKEPFIEKTRWES